MKHLLAFTLPLGLAFLTSAEARLFSIPAKSAAPGSEVSFPIYFDNASGCASIQIEVNYDVQLLEFTGFETGTGLGSQFEPTSFAENGVVTLIWTRATPLTTGNGSLGWVTFTVNPGAESGSETPLTIANHEISDETGVVDFSLTETVTAVSGTLMVSIGEPDTDNDGIPDAWEIANSLDPDVSNSQLDTDFDGRTDFLEYAFGGNPQLADPQRSPVMTSAQSEGATFLALTFDRRQPSSLVYRVWESTDLGTWDEIAITPNLSGTPVDHGDGTERVTVRSSFKMTGNGAEPAGFMKVEVITP